MEVSCGRIPGTTHEACDGIDSDSVRLFDDGSAAGLNPSVVIAPKPRLLRQKNASSCEETTYAEPQATTSNGRPGLSNSFPEDLPIPGLPPNSAGKAKTARAGAVVAARGELRRRRSETASGKMLATPGRRSPGFCAAPSPLIVPRIADRRPMKIRPGFRLHNRRRGFAAGTPDERRKESLSA